jgi:hypothetical protein
MKNILSSLLVILFFLFSCSETKTELINSKYSGFHFELENAFDNPQKIPLSEIGSELEYIPLESKPACMLGEINKLVLTDSFIFVSDVKKLLQFNRNGEFIKSIGSIGRGPGEYKSVIDFFIDQPDKKIYILSGRDVHIYNYQGYFQRSLKMNIAANQLIPTDSNAIIFHDFTFYVNFINSIPGFEPILPDTIFNIIITDNNGQNLIKFKHELRQGNEPYLNDISDRMYIYNGSITFMETGIDTAYHISNLTKNIYAVFNLGERKMDPHFVDRDKYSEITKEKYWISSLLESDDYFFINLIQGQSISTKCCLINKHSGEISMLSETGFTNDLDIGIPFWPKLIYNDSILVTHIEAFKFLDLTKPNLKHKNKFDKIRQGLTETSNPLIIILN